MKSRNIAQGGAGSNRARSECIGGQTMAIYGPRWTLANTRISQLPLTLICGAQPDNFGREALELVCHSRDRSVSKYDEHRRVLISRQC